MIDRIREYVRARQANPYHDLAGSIIPAAATADTIPGSGR